MRRGKKDIFPAKSGEYILGSGEFCTAMRGELEVIL